MKSLVLAGLERSRKLTVWAWGQTNGDGPSGPLDVNALGADGRPVGGTERALAQRMNAPAGAAAWLGAPDDDGATPCVVLGATEDRLRLRVLTPRGEGESASEWVWPVPSPGARPHASGPAVVTARTALVRIGVDSEALRAPVGGGVAARRPRTRRAGRGDLD